MTGCPNFLIGVAQLTKIAKEMKKKGNKTHSELNGQIVAVMVVYREIWMKKEDRSD